MGQEAGTEAAVHSLNSMYNGENNDTVLLVDVSNTFNSLNRELFLHNISYICPATSVFVKNCYNFPSRLFIIGGKELKSNEVSNKVILSPGSVALEILDLHQ